VARDECVLGTGLWTREVCVCVSTGLCGERDVCVSIGLWAKEVCVLGTCLCGWRGVF